jgi:hypothetical protein
MAQSVYEWIIFTIKIQTGKGFSACLRYINSAITIVGL